jgi:hypothetical protein
LNRHKLRLIAFPELRDHDEPWLERDKLTLIAFPDLRDDARLAFLRDRR